MAYNNSYRYERIIDIQNLVLRLKDEDPEITYKEIYANHIRPHWKISYKTFSNYLGINAKKLLREMKEATSTPKPKQTQLKLF